MGVGHYKGGKYGGCIQSNRHGETKKGIEKRNAQCRGNSVVLLYAGDKYLEKSFADR